MRILVLGGGAREAALARHLGAYGHAVIRVADPAAAPVEAELVILGPEGLIARDAGAPWRARGVPVLAPDPVAARLETSKAFARAFAERHGIPTAGGCVLQPGDTALPSFGTPGGVVKLDGLAGGKGTWVCADRESLAAAVAHARRARPAAPVVVEERLEGQELSVMALCDGTRAVRFPSARDAKRRFDGDLGPNTGGMGAWAPVPLAPREEARCAEVVARAVAGARDEGTPFRGILYAGLMVTGDDVRLLEFNVRFGDPEAQAVLSLVDEDLAPWFVAAAGGTLPDRALRLRRGASCCVVVAADAYPEATPEVDVRALPSSDGSLHVDGILDADGGGVAEGVSPSAPWTGRAGRVVSVTAAGASLAAARLRVYHALREVRGTGLSWRTDIGAA